jgi:hypothetical protein
MNEKETLVTETEAVAENVEQTTEETPKTYTQDEVDAIVGKRLARQEARIKKDYDRKYGDLVDTLKAGTGKESVEELNDTFSKFYESKGIKLNKKADYSPRDIEILARAEADEVIKGGFDEAVEEAERLKNIGVENMTAKEKAVFTNIAEYIKNTEQSRELAEIGITEDVYNSKAFKDFQSKFNPNTPIKDVYDIFSKTQPKKEHQTMGSMKNTHSEGVIKEYYSPEEAKKFTQAEINNNPELCEAIERSMLKWK